MTRVTLAMLEAKQRRISYEVDLLAAAGKKEEAKAIMGCLFSIDEQIQATKEKILQEMFGRAA